MSIVWASGLVTTALPASERGQAVAQRHRERVVPRRDDPDDALGHVVDLDPGQARGRRPSRRSVSRCSCAGAAVVAGGQRDVQRLVEGVLAGLAGLPADQVDDLVLPVQHQVVQPQQDRRPVVDARLRCHASCARRARAKASSTSASLDCGIIASGWPVIGEYVGDALAGGGDDPVGQRPDVVRLQGVGRPGVVLGVVPEGRSRDRAAHSCTETKSPQPPLHNGSVCKTPGRSSACSTWARTTES